MFLKIVKNIGIWAYIIFCVLAMLFVFGESTDSAGDSNPYLILAVGVLSGAALLFLVLKNVSFLRPMFFLLSLIAIFVSLGTTLFSDWWGDFRNTNGPVLGVAILILSFVMAFWARKEARTAGILIVLITLAPLIAEVILVGEIHLGGSTGALSVPGIIAGTLMTVGSLGDSR